MILIFGVVLGKQAAAGIVDNMKVIIIIDNSVAFQGIDSLFPPVGEGRL